MIEYQGQDAAPAVTERHIIGELEEQVRNLEVALRTARTIGMAMGILMATEKVTEQEAFDRIRTASQRSRRKLRDIAAEVAMTGALADRRAE